MTPSYPLAVALLQQKHQLKKLLSPRARTLNGYCQKMMPEIPD
ncbi:MAG: hypothetical protein AB4050_05655 [Synechococcus sp.]